jgi:dTDP-4-dehydrorhamnose 3,5-epimerase
VKLTPTPLPGVVIADPVVFQDERGWFFESFNEERFRSGLAELGLAAPPRFVQDNHSCSRAGVLRGLHYQVARHAQGKLVRVVRGAAFDVTVDIRPESPAYGQCFAIELSASNHRQLWIPAGLAHGFLALEDDTHFLYKTSRYYSKDCERAVHWRDPALAIRWPELPGIPYLVSPKDDAAQTLAAASMRSSA